MPVFEIQFKRLSEITAIETIGKLKNPHLKKQLNQNHGKAQWIYKKGTAKQTRVSDLFGRKQDGNTWETDDS